MRVGQETVRFVTRAGLFAEILAPDPAWLDGARARLAALSDAERAEAAARYMRRRFRP